MRPGEKIPYPLAVTEAPRPHLAPDLQERHVPLHLLPPLTGETSLPNTREIVTHLTPKKRNPIGRNLEQEFPSLQLRNQTENEILQDLQEVDIRYLNCGDPAENAAQRQRILESNVNGMREETVAFLYNAPSNLIPAETPLQPNQLANPQLPREAAAISPTRDVPLDEPERDLTLDPPPARKRGRPPSKNQATSSRKQPAEVPEKSSSLALLSWNCCGFGNPITVHRLRELNKKHAPDILFLMETKNNEEFINKEVPLPEFGSKFLVPPHSPGGGGLALFWKQEVELTVLSSCDNYIETTVTYKEKIFITTFVYGEPDHSKRKGIWEELTAKNVPRDQPWFLTGDFNDILDHSEKTGGPVRAEGTFGDFRAFLSQGDLFDIPYAGNPLSWRGVRYTHLVHCRLDRSMSNGAWADVFPFSRCHYLEFEGSDHRPLLTILESQIRKKRGIFRYDRSMKENPKITKIVEKAWHLSNTTSVEQRISQCRKGISKWNREHHLNAQKAIKEEKAKLEEEMSSSILDQGKIEEINENLKIAYRKEEDYWRQRSRTQWLALGDKNSGYFHAVTRGRRAVNKLAVIEDSNGIAVFEEEKIVQVISAYFQDIFITRSSNCVETVNKALEPCITDAMNAALTAQPSPSEIKEALFSISPDKAPGPDGFSACFFQSNWSIMEAQIVKEVSDILSSGILPSSINVTHVRLIPKTPSPKTVAEYRPIALLQCRAISDNVLITHEMLHYLKSSGATKHCSMVVKTDMSKAYDRLEWSFIVAVMERMGFHPRWINWLFQCIFPHKWYGTRASNTAARY
ncbi:unnamed protein product [Microthlaspi erraticum]|uniref:Endonuclease/exonuclease/phosphatase domain-containing protein n=1 Tax=Microthlaspi erraticum TaxID=1685480 RepID=A0A6D2K7Z1_9BRAS|nr:unnamed protein product [Microthlaspi erraticum]